MTNPVDESTPSPENHAETPVSFEDNINEQSLKKYTFKFLDPNEIPIEKSSEEPLPKYDYRFLNPEEIPVQTAENLAYNLLANDETTIRNLKKYGYQFIDEKPVTEAPLQKFTYSVIPKILNNYGYQFIDEKPVTEKPLQKFTYSVLPENPNDILPTEKLEHAADLENLLENLPENLPQKGFKFVHSHTPKEELLSNSGEPLKSYSYQFVDHSPGPSRKYSLGNLVESKQ